MTSPWLTQEVIQASQIGTLLVVILINRLEGLPVDNYWINTWHVRYEREGVIHPRINPQVPAIIRLIPDSKVHLVDNIHDKALILRDDPDFLNGRGLWVR